MCDWFQVVSELYNEISPSVEMTAFEIEIETEDEDEDKTETETEIVTIVISTNGEITYE